jgi:hypothetical protein
MPIHLLPGLLAKEQVMQQTSVLTNQIATISSSTHDSIENRLFVFCPHLVLVFAESQTSGHTTRVVFA